MNVTVPMPSGEGMDAAMDGIPEPESRKIRVMIADDHPIVRDGLRKLLGLEEDIDVVGEAADGRELIEK